MSVNTEMLLYDIPSYPLVEFTGLKNPSLKVLFIGYYVFMAFNGLRRSNGVYGEG